MCDWMNCLENKSEKWTPHVKVSWCVLSSHLSATLHKFLFGCYEWHTKHDIKKVVFSVDRFTVHLYTGSESALLHLYKKKKKKVLPVRAVDNLCFVCCFVLPDLWELTCLVILRVHIGQMTCVHICHFPKTFFSSDSKSILVLFKRSEYIFGMINYCCFVRTYFL